MKKFILTALLFASPLAFAHGDDVHAKQAFDISKACLLYTSDAADE